MKKRNLILIVILILLLVLLGSLVIYKTSFQNDSINFEKLSSNKDYLNVEVTVTDIYLEKIYAQNSTNNTDENNIITYTFDEEYGSDLSIGSSIKIYYKPEDINEENYIQNPIIEYLGKSRIFTKNTSVAISNSNYQPGNIVYNTFTADNNTDIDLSIFSISNNLYVKKITSYEEYQKYKEQLPELRDLTEDDFIYYYLVIILTDKTDTQYTYSRTQNTDDNLNILLRSSTLLNQDESTIKYNGLYLVIPNDSDYPEENLNILITNY